MTWFEALPPLIIITGALGAMGSLQGLVHRTFNDGKSKKIQRDRFEYMMDRRDEELKKSGEEEKNNGK